MSEEKKGFNVMAVVVPSVIAGLVGLFFVGSQQSARNQQNNVDNLPAVLARLEAVETQVRGLNEAVTGIRGSTLSESTLNATMAAVNERVTALDGQIGRRFQEVVNNPMALIRADVEDNENLNIKHERRISKLEAKIEFVLDKGN